MKLCHPQPASQPCLLGRGSLVIESRPPEEMAGRSMVLKNIARGETLWSIKIDLSRGDPHITGGATLVTSLDGQAALIQSWSEHWRTGQRWDRLYCVGRRGRLLWSESWEIEKGLALNDKDLLLIVSKIHGVEVRRCDWPTGQVLEKRAFHFPDDKKSNIELKTGRGLHQRGRFVERGGNIFLEIILTDGLVEYGAIRRTLDGY